MPLGSLGPRTTPGSAGSAVPGFLAASSLDLPLLEARVDHCKDRILRGRQRCKLIATRWLKMKGGRLACALCDAYRRHCCSEPMRSSFPSVALPCTLT